MGKIHGSLSHAGKVRNQTPKIEKTPKDKKLTGRAYRRMIYIKRYLNAPVLENGKKRSPNCQLKKD